MKIRILIEFETGNEAFNETMEVNVVLVKHLITFLNRNLEDTNIKDNNGNKVGTITKLLTK